jgi:BirA family transcriptional regulator, biotin operon repressor / biotin---[acetyl-CoA-carboxylase] ligase
METLFIGKNSIFLPEVDSTNSYAIDLLKNVNLPEGTVIHTAHQKTGRGQRGSVWTAEPLSNVTASLIIRPTFLDLKNQFLLYQITALACYDTMSDLLNKSQIDIKIKWPNDILVNGKKIAGILIENNLTGATINWSVIGIGINVNQESFPDLPRATSVKMITGESIAYNSALERFCRHFEKYYLALKQGRTEPITERYLSLLFGLNERLDFSMNDKKRSLLVTGVSSKGLLQLEDEAGLNIEADVKQLEWLY